MSETRHKLEEAEYFLDQTRANVEDPKPFVFNLSAFLSASRSVTFIMQKEFKKCSGFDDWYANKQIKMEQCEDLTFFNKLRVATIHKAAVRPSRKAEAGISDTMNISDSIAVRLIDKDGNVVSEYKSEPTQSDRPRHTEVDIRYSWYFEERPGDEGVELCMSYVEYLRNLVEECEGKFTGVDT